MKKNPLLTVLALVLACAMLFAACSSNSTQSSTPAEESSSTVSESNEESTAEPTAEPEENSAPEEGGDGEYASLEEYFSTPEAAADLEEMISGMDNEYFTFSVFAEGNTLVYGATATSQMDPDAEETIQMVDALQEAYESFGSTFRNIAEVLEEELDLTGVTVELRFQNADGSELFTMSF